jgi:uncharacterized membrane protein YedE/YeeE
MSTASPVLADEQLIIKKDADRFGVIGESPLTLFVYLLLGVAFGIILTKSELVSWFRIQEMFRFQSFHMYGTMGSAVLVAALSLQIIRRRGIRAAGGVVINVPPKEKTPGLKRYWMGGIAFGLGWALLGACPGPIFALIGSGLSVMIVALAAALLGTWAYAWLKPVLPH